MGAAEEPLKGIGDRGGCDGLIRACYNARNVSSQRDYWKGRTDPASYVMVTSVRSRTSGEEPISAGTLRVRI